MRLAVSPGIFFNPFIKPFSKDFTNVIFESFYILNHKIPFIRAFVLASHFD
jgi:hypothetical protein